MALVSHLSMLAIIDLRENTQLCKVRPWPSPAQAPMYRTKLIVAGRGLQQVDGRPVDATTRSTSNCFKEIFLCRVLANQMAKGKVKV